MLVLLRFPPDTVDRQRVEVTVQACVGRAGAVIGASDSSVDFELHDAPGPILGQLAALLRGLEMPVDTYFDIPSSGQRFGIFDF